MHQRNTASMKETHPYSLEGTHENNNHENPSKPEKTIMSLIQVQMFLSYLILQSIAAFNIFAICCFFLRKNPFRCINVLYMFYQFIFSITLSSISSPFSHPIIDEPLVAFSFFEVFVITNAFSGSAAAQSLFGFREFRRIRLRGALVGLIFCFHYVFKRRWVLEFPIIQRRDYIKFLMGIPLAVKSAFKLSTVTFIFSAVLLEIIPYPFLKCSIGARAFFVEQIVVFVSSFALLFLWEIIHLIHWVYYTERPVFAPPKGSAAAKTNPSEHLLLVLEESNPTSILRYLAYLDLCMVCENNADTWRRAAFFEKSGETYKRVIGVCLRPLEQLAFRLGEDLGNSADEPTNLSNQLSSPTDVRHIEEMDNFQLYAWCSRIVASLTACSRKEDKFGVAMLSGSNAAVMSTLISCLLAVENFMGKKTNLQSPNQSLGSADIKWKAAKSRRLCGKTPKITHKMRLDIQMAAWKRKTRAENSKAYAIADVLKTSIYQIVSVFHNEILVDTKPYILRKDWITSEKPLFGTREMLIEKLRLFLDCCAT